MLDKKTRFRLLLSYDGSSYCGWQRQKKKVPTIQGTIEQALKTIFQKDLYLVGAGRTDTGVHALGQSAHLDLCPSTKEAFMQKALNSILPKNICIRKIWKAPPSFHALYSVKRKIYQYVILNDTWPSVFRQKQIYHYPYLLNLQKLQSMGRMIEGRHDFKSFQNSGTVIKNTVRTIYSAKWILEKKKILKFQIEGEGFLKQMVRNLVGTQLALQKEKNCEERLKQIFSAKDRRSALKTAPACGLYLKSVSYPVELDSQCQRI